LKSFFGVGKTDRLKILVWKLAMLAAFLAGKCEIWGLFF
jgi:hypothetical protein